ncbi:class D sortase [Mesobacillus maritimus]|uniref:Class D sortase n=1 Tax=Mesobacillus maritimus TaxID=1643336 RepID=A0ABS7K9Y2_9BACI|nr:class D sortase [Mesobacillus maritimus]MBY0099074.1 class D sortase [Mesobacillus maritimus]
MKKKNILPFLIIAIGVVFIGIGLSQFIDSKVQTKQSLKEAKAIVQSHDENEVELPAKPEGRLLPDEGETTGLLYIPKINAELAIVEGTDPDDLEKGVGHFKDSYYPEENGQIILSGHRDTVFRKLGELKLADILEVQMSYGSYQYEITHTKIVDADDTSIITLQNDEEELILTTCYPFSYIGDAPDRYIIYAKRVDS